jgi:uncharacterized protein
MQSDKVYSSKNKWRGWLKISLLVYGVVGIAAYYLQDTVFFHPKKIAAHQAYAFSQPFKEVVIPVDNNTTYSLVQFTTPAPKGVVLYFHGNQDNVTHYATNAPAFTKKGYEVWMVDYPGFGKSTGTLKEETLYQQALQVYQVARARFAPAEIIIYGRSMGTGIATQLASIRDCKRLILETPYYSFTSLADRYLWMYPTSQMIKYTLPTYQFIEKVAAPITIFHGTDDGIIPFDNAKKLQPLLKRADEFVTIKGGSHNDLTSFSQLRTKLDSLLATPTLPVISSL